MTGHLFRRELPPATAHPETTQRLLQQAPIEERHHVKLLDRPTAICAHKNCGHVTPNRDIFGMCQDHRPQLASTSPAGEKSYQATYGPDSLPHTPRPKIMPITHAEYRQATTMLQQITDRHLVELCSDNPRYPHNNQWQNLKDRHPRYIAGVARAIARNEYEIIS